MIPRILFILITSYHTIAQQTDSEYNIEEIIESIKTGEEVLMFDDVQNVTVVVGTPGSGKSSFVHWIVADERVISENSKVKIKDYEPSLIQPEQVPVPGDDHIFLDCHSFNKYRATTFDVIINYFFKRVLDNYTNVKIILTYDFSHMSDVNDHGKLRDLLGYSTKFIKNMSKFVNSIALVVTKVDDKFPDNTTISNIAGYLRNYQSYLKELAVTKSTSEVIKLLDVLLMKKDDSYTRIGIMRVPTKPGPLSDIPEMRSGKVPVEKLLSELEFASKTSEDLSFTMVGKSVSLQRLIDDVTQKAYAKFTKIVQIAEARYRESYRDMTLTVSSLLNPSPVNVNKSYALDFETKIKEMSLKVSELLVESRDWTITDLPKVGDYFPKESANITDDIELYSKIFSFVEYFTSTKYGTLPWWESVETLQQILIDELDTFLKETNKTAEELYKNTERVVINIGRSLETRYSAIFESEKITKIVAELDKSVEIMRDWVNDPRRVGNLSQIPNFGDASIPKDASTFSRYCNYIAFLDVFNKHNTHVCDAVLQQSIKNLEVLKLFMTFSDDVRRKFSKSVHLDDLQTYVDRDNFMEFMQKVAKFDLIGYEDVKQVEVNNFHLKLLNLALSETGRDTGLRQTHDRVDRNFKFAKKCVVQNIAGFEELDAICKLVNEEEATVGQSGNLTVVIGVRGSKKTAYIRSLADDHQHVTAKMFFDLDFPNNTATDISHKYLLKKLMNPSRNVRIVLALEQLPPINDFIKLLQRYDKLFVTSACDSNSYNGFITQIEYFSKSIAMVLTEPTPEPVTHLQNIDESILCDSEEDHPDCVFKQNLLKLNNVLATNSIEFACLDGYRFELLEQSKNSIKKWFREIIHVLEQDTYTIILIVQDHYQQLFDELHQKINSFANNSHVEVDMITAKDLQKNISDVGSILISLYALNNTHITERELIVEVYGVKRLLIENCAEVIKHFFSHVRYLDSLELLTSEFITKPDIELQFTVATDPGKLQQLVTKSLFTIYESNVKLMEAIAESLEERYSDTKPLDRIVEELQEGVDLVSSWKEIACGGGDEVFDFLAEKMKLPEGDQFARNGKYIQFLQVFYNHSITPCDSRWMAPLSRVLRDLTNSQTWNQFLLDLFNKFADYDIQMNKLRYKQGIHVGRDNFDQFLDNLQLPGLSKVRGANVSEEQFRKLDQIFEITLRNTVEVICKARELVVQGSFVKFSDFLDSNGSFTQPCEVPIFRLKVIAVYAVFIDRDLRADYQLQVSVVAPKWVIIGSREINLDGTPGRGYDSSAGTSEDGLSGLPGAPAGNVLAMAGSFFRGRELVINCNGGHGGRGQDGGDGLPGAHGRHAQENEEKYCSNEESFERCVYYGKRGEVGGKGGDGGVGGDGGAAGEVFLSRNDGDSPRVRREKGSVGVMGQGGKGGPGGRDGDHLQVIFPDGEEIRELKRVYSKAETGVSGFAGVSEMDSQPAAKPEWSAPRPSDALRSYKNFVQNVPEFLKTSVVADFLVTLV